MNYRKTLKASLLGSAVAFLAVASICGAAQAQTADDGSLTFHGITFYGTVDAGVAYQTNGKSVNGDTPLGLNYMANATSTKKVFSAANNGMSTSNFGIKGKEAINDDLFAVFKLEVAFNPLSGAIANGPKSLADNAGVAYNQQTANADSSMKGEFFRTSYVGIGSKTFGTVTFGRQNTVLLDNMIAYDPMGGSYAFSMTGYSGKYAGGGYTGDARLDNQIRYSVEYGPVHFNMGYQGSNELGFGSAAQFGVGATMAGLSGDFVYSRISEGLSLASGATAGTLAGTISDNEAYAGNVKYTYGPSTTYAGYERISLSRPSHGEGGVLRGSTLVAGYTTTLSAMAATGEYKLDLVWFGEKYAVNSDLDLIGAVYRGVRGGQSGSAIGGAENIYSVVADYKFTKRFDTYVGVEYSNVSGALAANTVTSASTNSSKSSTNVGPMVGARLKF